MSAVSPCFANCGQPACQALGCVRVYNHENRGFGRSWVKIPCGCWAEWTGTEWKVAAEAFTCDHHQGDHVDGAPPQDGTT